MVFSLNLGEHGARLLARYGCMESMKTWTHGILSQSKKKREEWYAMHAWVHKVSGGKGQAHMNQGLAPTH